MGLDTPVVHTVNDVHWSLVICFWIIIGLANAFNVLPGYYVRKDESQKIRRLFIITVEYAI